MLGESALMCLAGGGKKWEKRKRKERDRDRERNGGCYKCDDLHETVNWY